MEILPFIAAILLGYGTTIALLWARADETQYHTLTANAIASTGLVIFGTAITLVSYMLLS